MESRKDQCRKLGCPGCRDCLDIRNPEHKKIILKNEIKSLEIKHINIREDLREVEAKLNKKKAELDEVE